MAFPLLGNPKQGFFDSSGSPLTSGTLAVLDPADDSNKASYPTADDADAATNANVNPVVLDSRGEPPNGLFGIDGEDYKLTLKDSAGATVWTVDDVIVPIDLPGARQTAAELTASVTPTDTSYPPGDLRRYGGIGDDAKDNASALTDALKIDHPVYISPGTWRINSKVTWDGGAVRMQGDGGFSSQIAWYGGADTMLEIGKDCRHLTSIEGVYFNARSLATKILHVGVSATTVAVVRQMSLIRSIFSNADGANSHAIFLGDFTAQPTIAEADIATFHVDKCEFLDNKFGITWDSDQAVGVNITDTFMSRVTITIKSHINMVRGGSATVKGCSFGGASPDGLTFCFYVKDGWIHIEDSEVEFSLSGGGGGVLHLDTPALSTSTLGLPSSMIGNRCSNDGITGTGNHILISSDNHPLFLLGNQFHGRSGSTTNYAIDNTNGSRIVSMNNTYVGRFWNGTSQFFTTSFGDVYDDGSNLLFMPVNSGRQRNITSADSPYAVVLDDETIISSSGACTINLPACDNPHTGGGGHRRITIIRTASSGTTTVTPNGSDTINGLSSVAIANAQYGGLTIESDGSATWQIVSYYAQSDFSVASSGTGTVKMANANSSNSIGWLELSPGKFVPYWTDTTP